jgi:hypothetical protein
MNLNILAVVIPAIIKCILLQHIINSQDIISISILCITVRVSLNVPPNRDDHPRI